MEETIKKERISLPSYSLKEELWNSISHGLGAIFGICVFIVSLYFVIIDKNFSYLKLISILIYGISIICLYTISCIYHALNRNNGKKVLRILDHDMVFFLIAGTYTPFCLVSLFDSYFYNVSLGIILFILVWSLAILGIVFNSINVDKYNVLSNILYIALGWSIMIFVVPFYNSITAKNFGFLAFIALLIGGILYSLGAVFYAIGAKKKGVHCMFHFYVLAASVFQFIAILYGVIL